MFHPVRAEEMAFAMSIFVSAADGQMFSSGPSDAQASLRERQACQHFLSFLAAEHAERSSLRQAANSQKTPLFQAIFAVWEHDREDAGRLSITARVLAFHFLMEQTSGALLRCWCSPDPKGEETVLLHPAVVEAIAKMPLSPRGQLHVKDFVQAVEVAAKMYPERADAGQVALSAKQAETEESV